jgi:hypothetical protein
LGLDEFFCPSSNDWNIGGTFTGESYDSIEFGVIKCQGDGCQTNDQINEDMAGQSISVAISNFFFDVQNYDNPINITLEDEFNFHLVPGFLVEKHLKVRVNKVYDYTNYWYEFAPKEYTYYSVNSIEDRFQPEGLYGEVIKIVLKMDYKYTLIERRTYTVYDMLGNIGGFMSIVLACAALFVQIFSDKLYAMTLLSYFYKIEDDTKYSTSKVQNVDHNVDQNVDQNKRVHIGAHPRTGKPITIELQSKEEEKVANSTTLERSSNGF